MIQTIRLTFACLAALGLASIAGCARSPDKVADKIGTGAELNGVWQISEPTSLLKLEGDGAIPFTAEGQQRYSENERKRQAKSFASYDYMTSRCSAPGTPRAMLSAKRFRILQQPDTIMMAFEQNRYQRIIQTDLLPKQTSYFFGDEAEGVTAMGTSKGHWEGDTLVVTTDGFTDRTLLDDLLPHGYELKVTEHIRLIEPNTLQVRIDIEDPEFYIRPWQTVLTYSRRPEVVFPEDVCLDTLQGEPPLPTTVGTPPTGEQAQPDPNFGFGLSRAAGLQIGPQGFTVGPKGGLNTDLERKGFALPMPAPLPPNMPQPTSDPRDFVGVWQQADQYLEEFERLTDMYGSKLPFTALGRKIMDRRLLAVDMGNPYITPTVMCRPSGPDWGLIHIPVRIYQSKDRLDLFAPMDRMWWQIPINPALALPADTRTYAGRSTANWEGNELVVKTAGFKNRLWLTFRGTPLSPNGTLVHRISKINDQGNVYLQVITQVIDPDYYTKPWKFARMLAWRPDMAPLQEFNCEDQFSLVTNTGSDPEPND